ncbi:MAG: RHS repeat-associated core domain-containing protein, partial [Candidatus Saccharibacteria bacterium]|nr:RHS repeat-associated core domain-containing protein [Candidatus Saccharibacteria bacterium]
GMPVEFKRQNSCYDIHEKNVCDSTKLEIKYDGSGRRISKTRMMKTAADGEWYVDNVTHYTGIGTEVRETHVNGQEETKVVVKSLQGESRKNKLACSYDRTAAADAKGVHMSQGLGRYMPEDAVDGFNGVRGDRRAGYRPPAKFEWYLKNHLGSTMLVYGTSAYSDPLNSGYKGGVKAAYDYRAFGEQVDLTEPTDKVTENFTGKEKDDETELNYFGARYLDPMLGMWISVDPARQFSSPYLYVGNGVNPIGVLTQMGMKRISTSFMSIIWRQIQLNERLILH